MAAYTLPSITILITAVAFSKGRKDAIKWPAGMGVILDTITLIQLLRLLKDEASLRTQNAENGQRLENGAR